MTKQTKWSVRPAKTQISLGIRPVWSESSPSAWRKLVSLATYWAHSEDSDQSRRLPRLIWVFAGRTLILLLLSFRGSYVLLYLSDCGTEYTLDHGFANFDGKDTTFNQKVPVICNKGYEILGESEITCLATGDWSNDTTCHIEGEWR